MSIVRFLEDPCEEMVRVEVDGVLVYEGGFFNFDIIETTTKILEACGQQAIVEEYAYE